MERLRTLADLRGPIRLVARKLEITCLDAQDLHRQLMELAGPAAVR